jgi:hypothetical protein
MSLSRLSDLNITDPILRAGFYKRVIEHVESPLSDVKEYVLKPDETYRPDLASYRHYRTKELAWLVALVSDVDDVADPLPVGESVYLPSAAWVRRELRAYLDELGL